MPVPELTLTSHGPISLHFCPPLISDDAVLGRAERHVPTLLTGRLPTRSEGAEECRTSLATAEARREQEPDQAFLAVVVADGIASFAGSSSSTAH